MGYSPSGPSRCAAGAPLTEAAVLNLLENGISKRRRSRKLFVVLALTAASMTGAKSHVPPLQRYRELSFREFIVDGVELAKKTVRVELSGLYTRDGREAVLYEGENAYIMDQVGPSPGTAPTIPLLTDDASHGFREIEYSCDSQRAYGRYGCMLEVRGVATMCVLTNAFGAQTEEPCIEVTDGSDAEASAQTADSAQQQAPIQVPTQPVAASSYPAADSQKVRDCIHSSEMGEVGDAYRKCLKRVQAESLAKPAPIPSK